jgi:hypothetical protein
MLLKYQPASAFQLFVKFLMGAPPNSQASPGLDDRRLIIPAGNGQGTSASGAIYEETDSLSFDSHALLAFRTLKANLGHRGGAVGGKHNPSSLSIEGS